MADFLFPFHVKKSKYDFVHKVEIYFQPFVENKLIVLFITSILYLSLAPLIVNLSYK